MTNKKVLNEILFYYTFNNLINEENKEWEKLKNIDKTSEKLKKLGAPTKEIEKFQKISKIARDKIKKLNNSIEDLEIKMSKANDENAKEFFKKELEKTKSSKEEVLKSWKDALEKTWRFINPVNRTAIAYTDIIDKLKEIGDKYGGTGIAQKLGVYGSSAQFVGGAGTLLAPVLLSLILISASRKVYERYLSKYARACEGKVGIQRTKCIKIVKINAYRKQLHDLQNALKACQYSRNKQECYKNIGKKMDAITKKIKKLSKK